MQSICHWLNSARVRSKHQCELLLCRTTWRWTSWSFHQDFYKTIWVRPKEILERSFHQRCSTSEAQVLVWSSGHRRIFRLYSPLGDDEPKKFLRPSTQQVNAIQHHRLPDEPLAFVEVAKILKLLLMTALKLAIAASSFLYLFDKVYSHWCQSNQLFNCLFSTFKMIYLQIDLIKFDVMCTSFPFIFS